VLADAGQHQRRAAGHRRPASQQRADLLEVAPVGGVVLDDPPELVLNAPPDDVGGINDMATAASVPTNPDRGKAWQGMHAWISQFVETRRHQPPRGDVVDAVLAAEIEGRPIAEDEIIGVIQLLILGGLETTAGALGQFMIRFCREPEIPALLRAHPERIPDAGEELLRLEPPFIAIARTAMVDTEIGGRQIRKGDKVMIYWASAPAPTGVPAPTSPASTCASRWRRWWVGSRTCGCKRAPSRSRSTRC
jgi:hypothetical protein